MIWLKYTWDQGDIMKLIIRKDKVFTHIGIYLDAKTIFHYSSMTNNFFRNDKVVKCNSLDVFSRNRRVELIEYKEDMDVEELKSLSEIFMEKCTKYHLVRNNCYTFVFWCLYKKRKTTVKDILHFARNYNIPIFSFYI